MSDQTPYYVAFSYMLGIGPVHFAQLMQRFGDPKSAYQATTKDLYKILGRNLAEKFDTFRKKCIPHSIVKYLLTKNVQILHQGSSYYPKKLVHIPDPPICLYLRGNINILHEHPDDFIAIVGTRKPSSYGKETTRQCVKLLCEYDYTIISGMALGIDSIAHSCTLDNGGKTIAVLGCGIEVVYPHQNTHLFKRILDCNGAVISEFPPPMTTMKGLFVSRNRIISGLSKAVIVVEGTEKSGTLITARYAAEQGRDVFAIPGEINSPLSRAPNLLIKNGATIITSPQDILESYNTEIKSHVRKTILNSVDAHEKMVLEQLIHESSYIDTIARTVNMPIPHITSILTSLEIKGFIAKNDKGEYYITNGYT